MWQAGPATFTLGLMAQAKVDPELIGLIILLVGLTVLGIVIVLKVRRWREEEQGSLAPQAQIEDYRALVERGDLDPRDFERIKALLENQADGPPPSPSPPNPTSESFQAPPHARD